MYSRYPGNERMSEVWDWHPPVGVWIGFLALFGVLVPYFRDKVGGCEKALWTFIFFGLLLLEMKSVYQDRNENQAQFEATVTRLQNIMSEATGGDSYINFGVSDPMGPTEIEVPGIAKGYVAATASPHLFGEFPLHDVVVSTFCSPGVGWIGPLTGVDYGTVLPNEIGRPRQGIYLQFPPTAQNGATCHLFISTSNGSYDQQVHFLMQNDKWTWASTLAKYGHSEFKQEFFGTGFPKDQKW